MREKARRELTQEGFGPAEMRCKPRLGMRFVGQAFAVSVLVPPHAHRRPIPPARHGKGRVGPRVRIPFAPAGSRVRTEEREGKLYAIKSTRTEQLSRGPPPIRRPPRPSRRTPAEGFLKFRTRLQAPPMKAGEEVGMAIVKHRPTFEILPSEADAISSL